MQSIKSFNLTNNAWFVCAPGCNFTNPDGEGGRDESGGNIAMGSSEFYDPGQFGVKPGATIELYIDVHGGSDRTGGDQYLYDPTATVSAYYSISGSTLDSSVHFNGVQ